MIHQEVAFEKEQLEELLQWTFSTAIEHYRCKRIVLDCSHVMRSLQRKAKENKFSYKLPLKPAEERLDIILSEVNEYKNQVEMETIGALLKMMQKASGNYDGEYAVEFPGDDYEAMCLALIKASLLCNQCPEWVYDGRGDLLPNSRVYNLLSIYCLKHLPKKKEISVDWASLYNRY